MTNRVIFSWDYRPAFNLAAEEYLIRNCPYEGTTFFVYLNSPSVVLGKHQVPWAEANMPYLDANGVELHRRISGGGTVFHDLGNVNFAVVSPFSTAQVNDYNIWHEPICELIRSFGLQPEINCRNAVLIDGKKVSGTAQFTNRKKVLTHGTLLVSADKKMLSNALDVSREIESRASRSVPSETTDLSTCLGEPKEGWEIANDLIQHLLWNREEEAVLSTFEIAESAQIEKLASEKFDSWNWRFGKSPKCKLKGALSNPKIRYEIDLNKAKILEFKFAESHENWVQVEGLKSLDFEQFSLKKSALNKVHKKYKVHVTSILQDVFNV